MRLKCRKWVVALLLVGEVSRAGTLVGILRLGEVGTGNQERAQELMESRLRRWLENMPGFHSDIAKVGAAAATSWRLQLLAARLKVSSREILTIVARGVAPSEDLLTRQRALRKSLPGYGEFGPIAQEALLAEVAARWRKNEKRETAPLIEKASLLHPDAVIESLDRFGEESQSPEGDLTLLEAAIWGETSKARKRCPVQVRGLGPRDVLNVNGFPFGERREFQLPRGGSYLFQARRGEQTFESVRIFCELAGSRVVSFASPMVKEKEIRSLFLVELVGENFAVSLFTPEVGLDVIPFERPLNASELIQDPTRRYFPVETAKVWSLLVSHGLVGPPEKPAESSGPQMERDGTRWYNSWKLWLLAGGLAAGAFGVYQVLQHSGDDNQTRGLTIHWE